MKQHGIILVPLDGSKLAEAILPEVETVARAFDATIRIIRACYSHGEAGQTIKIQQAEDYVRVVAEGLKAKGLKVYDTSQLDTDAPFTPDAAQAILDYSKKADIIMMSTHGYSGIKHYLLGSVAEKVVHHATKPVYLVRSVIKQVSKA